MAYISESKRAFEGIQILRERKRLGFESKEKRCIRKVYIYNILLIFLGET